MFTLGLHLGCSLWLKAFVTLSWCFRVASGFHIWIGTTPLLKTVNPQQAEAESTSIMARPRVCPLRFPHEDKEEEVEMYPACFLSAEITCAENDVQFELWKTFTVVPNFQVSLL